MLASATLFITAVLLLGEANGCGNRSDSMSKEARKEIAHSFNLVRQFNYKPTGWNYPYSKNMYKLVWNCDLEKLSQARLPSGCSDQVQGNSYYAENFFRSNNTASQTEEIILHKAITSWVNEGTQSKLTATSAGVYYTGQRDTLNYLNMIRGEARAVGCSTTIQANTCVMALCIFNIPPLSMGHLVYEKGPYQGCTDDSDCTTFYNSTCKIGSGMCKSTENLTIITTTSTCSPATTSTDTTGTTTTTTTPATSTTTTTTTTTTKPMPSQFYCKSNCDVAADDRQMIVRNMNNLRRNTVKGLTKSSGENYPSGRNMYGLEWSCALEALAEKQLPSDCGGPMGSTNYTQNYFRATYKSKPTANQTFADAYLYWAGNSSRKAPSTNKSCVYYDDGNQTPNITFLNMIRASITAVGCSTSSCESDGCYTAVVSCLFNRAPLSCGDPVYHFGGGGCESGSNCTTYSNSTCNGGLCYKSALPTTNTTVAPTRTTVTRIVVVNPYN